MDFPLHSTEVKDILYVCCYVYLLVLGRTQFVGSEFGNFGGFEWVRSSILVGEPGFERVRSSD